MKVIVDIMDHCDTKIDHIKYTYITWSSDFALYLENYLMDEGRTLDNGMKVILWIMDQCDTKIDLIKNMLVSDLYFVVQ